ncbi:hypothetical protein Bra1253DRAFT_00231, partial [Bradyrhizobium sp. WSM1253]
RVVALCISAGLVGGEAFSVDASLIKADVNKTRRLPGDQPITWPKAEEASHAVREYIAALDAANSDKDGDEDGGGSSEGSRRRKPPKEVSLTDPQATWVTRPGVDPFFAYDANYLIDNKAGIILDAVGTRANRAVEIAVTQIMVDRVERRFDLRPKRLAGDTAYGAVRLLKWLVDRKITPHVPVWDKSARPDGTFSRADFVFDKKRNVYVCPGGAELTSTGNIDQGHIVYYRASKSDCSSCALKPKCTTAVVRKITRDVNEDVARSCPCAGEYGSLRAIAPRAQKGRDAVCSYETHSQARPASVAGPEWRQGGSAAHSHRAEPEAAGQANLPSPATTGSPVLKSTSKMETADTPYQKNRRNSKAKLAPKSETSFATQSGADRT